MKAPRVSASPAALECKLVSATPLLALGGQETHNHFIIGQVTGVYIDDTYITDGQFDVAAAGIIARLGYRQYAKVTDVFEMIRPA